jgi:hypothetical protein
LPRGRFDLVDPSLKRMSFEAHEVVIRDMRAAPSEISIERQGFMLAKHASKVARKPEMAETNLTAQPGMPPINKAYYDELLPLIGQISGARAVIPQSTGLTVRFSPRATKKSWAGAADFIHLDVTMKSVQRFLEFSLAAQDRPIAPWRRMCPIDRHCR